MKWRKGYEELFYMGEDLAPDDLITVETMMVTKDGKKLDMRFKRNKEFLRGNKKFTSIYPLPKDFFGVAK